MGFFSKIKGWLNIGGVTVSNLEIMQPIVGKEGTVQGSFQMTSKTDRKVLKYTYRFKVMETKGKGDEKKVSEETIAEVSLPVEVMVTAGQTIDVEFEIPYNMKGLADKMSAKGGVLGAMGKMAKLAGKVGGESSIRDYFVEVAADIEGTPVDATASKPVRVTAPE